MKTRNLFSLILCLVLLFSLALPVAAEGDDDSTQPTQCSHTYGDPTVNTAATCTAAGRATYTCTKCQHSESREIAKLEHKYGTGKITKDPSCAEAGEALYTCLVCGHEKTSTINKLSTHTYDNACDPDCNVCGTIRNAGHKITTGWHSRSSAHYHICDVCKKEVDTGNHFPGPAATEEKDQICLTCGFVMTKKKSHVHQLSEDFKADEYNHWKVCSGCQQQVELGEHAFDGACDETCDTCGYVNEYAHSYADAFVTDEASHWVECTLCGQKGNLEAHIPGTEADEDKAQYCAVCAIEMNPALAHVHTLDPDWITDGESHWHTCTDCAEAQDLAAHSWDAGVEEEDGSVTYTCTVCAAAKTEGTEAPAEAEEKAGIPWVPVAIAALLSGAAGAGIAVFALTRAGKKQKGRFGK